MAPPSVRRLLNIENAVWVLSPEVGGHAVQEHQHREDEESRPGQAQQPGCALARQAPRPRSKQERDEAEGLGGVEHEPGVMAPEPRGDERHARGKRDPSAHARAADDPLPERGPGACGQEECVEGAAASRRS